MTMTAHYTAPDQAAWFEKSGGGAHREGQRQETGVLFEVFEVEAYVTPSGPLHRSPWTGRPLQETLAHLAA